MVYAELTGVQLGPGRWDKLMSSIFAGLVGLQQAYFQRLCCYWVGILGVSNIFNSKVLLLYSKPAIFSLLGYAGLTGIRLGQGCWDYKYDIKQCTVYYSIYYSTVFSTV